MILFASLHLCILHNRYDKYGFLTTCCRDQHMWGIEIYTLLPCYIFIQFQTRALDLVEAKLYSITKKLKHVR